MKKLDWKFFGQIIILLGVIIILVISFIRKENLGVIISFLVLLSLIIILKENHRYTCNTPYKIKKNKKSFFERALIGLLAGIHYVHFMFSYSHEKYNTQVDSPTTVECYFGWFWMVLLILYGFISYLININFEGNWYLIPLVILLFTNLIDFFRYKK